MDSLIQKMKAKLFSLKDRLIAYIWRSVGKNAVDEEIEQKISKTP